MKQQFAQIMLALAGVTAFGAAAYAADNAAQYQAAIANPARTDADRKDDAKRKPAEFLAFAQVRPGMKVLDVATGGGATAELLALAVSPGGEVWAQSAKPSENLDKRLAAHPQANLHPVVAPFENPAPAGAGPFDLITLIMNYHDLVNAGVDRAAMNKSLYNALKPGGHFVVIDNAAKDGSGLSDTKTLHRIDQATLVAEVTKAGFVVDTTSDYLHVKDDPRELPFFKMDGRPDDKFVVRFVKK
ncbi:class I SAM-dependent methyltransferase [Duganella callida]|uniref:Methyltransferase domain-containing protein n=1 Tax=Duganella callida TaxID=2561932 RepID=A0A4Y9SHT8_9BURK|nr:methyltransferase domain-containing protein [Duganella callida]TFW20102.1 methyltransferase domain-containing protein [Duganella callida]